MKTPVRDSDPLSLHRKSMNIILLLHVGVFMFGFPLLLYQLGIYLATYVYLLLT